MASLPDAQALSRQERQAGSTIAFPGPNPGEFPALCLSYPGEPALVRRVPIICRVIDRRALTIEQPTDAVDAIHPDSSDSSDSSDCVFSIAHAKGSAAAAARLLPMGQTR